MIPLQKVWSETPLITGIGLTVIEKVFEDPAHVFDIGVTVIGNYRTPVSHNCRSCHWGKIWEIWVCHTPQHSIAPESIAIRI